MALSSDELREKLQKVREVPSNHSSVLDEAASSRPSSKTDHSAGIGQESRVAALERTADSRAAQESVPQSHANGAGVQIPAGAQKTLQKKQRATDKRSGSSSAQPHSEAGEKATLACMIQAPATVMSIVQQSIGPDHFYIPKNRRLFIDACDHFNHQGDLTLPTLTQYMSDVGHLQEAGGPGYLSELAIDFTSVPESISYYLDILKDKHARRELIRVGHLVSSKAQALAEHEDTSEIFEELFTRLECVRTGLQSTLRLPSLCDISMHLGDNLPPEPAELISNVLHQGSKFVVGGTSKGRKTWALIDMAVSVATGVAWWGFECVKGPVCYINFEIQDAFFAKRVNAVCTAKQVKLEEGMLFAWNLRGHGEGIENLVKDLLAVLRHRKFVLIIIDPIYKALGRRDENKAGDVASMLNELEKIAVKTGAAVAFGAHYSKGNQALKESIDRIGGSGVFARDPDSILTMTAHAEEECFTVDATLRNFAPIEPFVVRWEKPLFRRADDLDPHTLKQPRGPKEKHSPDLLLDQLSLVEGATPKKVIKDLDEQHGVSRKTVYRMKDRLKAKNLMIVREGLWWRAG